MESADVNSNDQQSAAAELPASVLHLPKCLSASLLIYRRFLWPPIQPLPCLLTQSSPSSSSGSSSRLWPGQPAVSVLSIPRFRFTFYPSREPPQHQASFWASGSSDLPLSDTARFSCPIPRLGVRPVHPQKPTVRPCTLPVLLQLWWLQLPSWVCFFQFSVTNRETHLQTRIWSFTAILLKALLLLCLNCSSQFFPSFFAV